MSFKTCPHCKVSLPVASFGKSSKATDGLQSWCKACRKESAKIQSAKFPEKHRAKWRNAGRVWREKNPDIKAAMDKAYREENTDQINARKREWYAKTAEDRRVNLRKWIKNNPDAAKRIRDTSYAKNKESLSARNKVWRRENSDKVNVWTATRRVAKLQATLPDELTDLVVAESYALAKVRKQVTGFEWHVDHIVPLQSKVVCGLHSWANIQVIPGVMNLRKSNKFWPDMPGAI